MGSDTHGPLFCRDRTQAFFLLGLLLGALGFDPAASSAPFVASFSDVTGTVIYFTIATLLLAGVLL